ncbi:acyl carrier protein [Streptomyces sp. NPDC048611]|uniref:acyl carrier protein n=1 Tax=Streptomyces sp. NPDC048611 TaxID=3155635 RepID=UPI003437856F
MADSEIFEGIKAFIEDKGLKGQGTIEADTPLLAWGILDSLTLARLTTHLEAEYGLTIPSGTNLGVRFKTLQDICDFVDELRGEDAAEAQSTGKS